jgi:phenylalanine-4-hydroxylase
LGVFRTVVQLCTASYTTAQVAGRVPDEVFFNHLANRRFPVGAFVRPEEEFDISSGNPWARAAVGEQRAMQLAQLANLARLYWYTVEFGLFRTTTGLRIFGAGILSSVAKCEFCA